MYTPKQNVYNINLATFHAKVVIILDTGKILGYLADSEDHNDIEMAPKVTTKSTLLHSQNLEINIQLVR